MEENSTVKVYNRTQRIILRKHQLEDIAENFVLTKHSQERLLERFGTIEREIIAEKILHPLISYQNTDGSMNIAVSETEYFVVKYNYNNEPLLITFKEESFNGYNVFDKLIFALQGRVRIVNTNNEE